MKPIDEKTAKQAAIATVMQQMPDLISDAVEKGVTGRLSLKDKEHGEVVLILVVPFEGVQVINAFMDSLKPRIVSERTESIGASN